MASSVATNYYDHLAKTRTLEALDAASDSELFSLYSALKMPELASAAECVFSGNLVTETEVKDRTEARLPTNIRSAEDDEIESVDAEADEPDSNNLTVKITR